MKVEERKMRNEMRSKTNHQLQLVAENKPKNGNRFNGFIHKDNLPLLLKQNHLPCEGRQKRGNEKYEETANIANDTNSANKN